MKNLFFILICSYLLTIIGCNNETPSPTQNPIEENSTLVLKLSEGTAPISEAKVIIGNDTLYTGEKGTVSFPDLSNGSYKVAISHKEFAFMDTTIVYTGDTIKLTPNRLYYDYFPLEIGNKWIFDYTFAAYGNHGADDTIRSGSKIEWEVIKVEYFDDYIQYLIKETDTLITKYNYIDIRNTGFIIKEYGYDSLVYAAYIDPSMDEKVGASYPLGIDNNTLKCKRYISVKDNPNNEIEIYDVKLRRNTGIVYIRHGYTWADQYSYGGRNYKYVLKQFVESSFINLYIL